MKIIDAKNLRFDSLNGLIRTAGKCIMIMNCSGQRFIGSGSDGQRIEIGGTPGNALGAYLDGSEILVRGNAPDAVGDTMNDGKILIEGSAGDALGYARRGGEIYVRDNVGYRAGIHMKAYADKRPVMVIGGSAGSFLGEYQAGGLIIVLNKNDSEFPVGRFCGTGMHGGKIFIRSEKLGYPLPKQVRVTEATEEELNEIKKYIEKYCDCFDEDETEFSGGKFFLLTPDSNNPYRQLYVEN